MARAATTSSPTPAATAPRDTWPRAAALLAGAAAFVLGLYLVHPFLFDHRFPLGPDGPVYTWWTRYAEVAGVGAIPHRPGVPAAILTLDRVLGIEPLEAITVLGPVLAVACGMAAAAIVEVALGGHAARAALAIGFTAGYASHLAGGWLGNLGFSVLFLGAIAMLAAARSSRRGPVAAAVLIGTAGLTHDVFLALGVAILLGAALALAPAARRQMRRGARASETLAARIAAATLGGAAVTVAGLAAVSAPTIARETSEDAAFRRLGLRDVLRGRYRERLATEARWASLALAGGAAGTAAATALRAPGRAPSHERTTDADRAGGDAERFLLATGATWAALTAAGVVALGTTGWGPGNRLLAFAFFLPVGAAIGVVSLWTHGRRRLLRGLAGLVAVAVLGGSIMQWYRKEPSITAAGLAAANAAGRVVRDLPTGTPLVFVVSTGIKAPVFHLVTFGNIIRMGLPPERIPDMLLVAGRPEDVLAGRPSRTGDPEHDRYSAATVDDMRRLRTAPAMLVLRPFNRPGFGDALRLGPEVAPGVVALRGLPAATRISTGDGDLGMTPASQVALAIALLVLLTLLGLGWGRWALPGVGPRGVLAVAPSAGLGVVIVAAFAAEALGASAAGAPAAGAAAVLAVVGWIAGIRAGADTGARPRRGQP